MKKAFSLVELLVSVIVISLLLATLAPVITKKTKNTHVALTQSSEITTECQNSPNYGSECEICTKKHCIRCGLKDCPVGQYVNTSKCECSPCTDWGAQCLECNSKGCTLCNNSPMRYVKNGYCDLCPTSPTRHYCDGAVDYAECPTEQGFYCNDQGVHKCVKKHDSKCISCSETTCFSCGEYYFPKGNKCEQCTGACLACTDKTNCTKCQNDWVLDKSSGKGVCSKTCDATLEGCQECTSASVCTMCREGYYLSNGKCLKCAIANCLTCASNGTCKTCGIGYYESGSRCLSCTSKFGENCIKCDSNKCLSCAPGFTLQDDSTCVDNNNKFGCSDSNFMQIGKLCITRRNMGDSSTLAIPSTVTIAQARNEYCYSGQAKCCWKGATTHTTYCNATSSSYSGCNRTVCNLEAAKEICAKFNYQGKTWRLATYEEMKNWDDYSSGYGSNGLQLCDQNNVKLNNMCSYESNTCLGNYDHAQRCLPEFHWSSTPISSFKTYAYMHVNGLWYWYPIGYAENAYAYSVRCVTEMD